MNEIMIIIQVPLGVLLIMEIALIFKKIRLKLFMQNNPPHRSEICLDGEPSDGYFVRIGRMWRV